MTGFIHVVCIVLLANCTLGIRVRKGERNFSSLMDLSDGDQDLKLLQWNVFEDGLADTPGNIGLQTHFDEKLSALLKELCVGQDGQLFWGFKKVRSYRSLPPLAKIDSTKALFGHIDVLYSALYHPLGGEACFAASADECKHEPEIRNSLRTLFLRSHLDQEKVWTAPAFEEELGKVTDRKAGGKVEKIIRDFKTQAFDSIRGYLTWDRVMVNGDFFQVWKREENVWEDKWLSKLQIFKDKVQMLDSLPANERFAVSKFVKVSRVSPRPTVMTSMIEMFVEGGVVEQIRSMTFQSALRWLLENICKHSQDNPKADAAIKAFVGSQSIPATAKERADEISKIVLDALEDWYQISNIQARHSLVKDTIERTNPDIATLVEYDREWQKLTVPAGYAIEARGSAVIMYKQDKFSKVKVELGYSIEMVSGNSPKANCVQVLQRKVDEALFLVAAVHFESGEPRDARKASKRQTQMKAILEHLGKVAKTLKEAGKSVKVILGGDFNALAEEFIYGTEKGFWDSPAVLAVKPSLTKPEANTALVAAPDPALAVSAAGSVYLTDKNLYLHLVSTAPTDGCSRAGQSGMVIDFMFVGGLDSSTPVDHHTLAITKPPGASGSACESISNSVRQWGSDHVPVACEVATSQQKSGSTSGATLSFFLLTFSFFVAC